ncbi:MAG TPA: response regulator [Candidatus Methylomirabilis sp.]|nr:response regulator [Candidatus Methylomirabilis sp.]
MLKWPSVLVVEDDAEMRAVVLEVLRSEGYEVVGAEDGAEAVRAIRARRFNVILMDKNLPGPSGLALLPELLEVCPGTRIIMMTAFGDVPSYVEAVEKGAADYLFKPFQMEELKSAIRKALALDAASRV